jgi:hypothetical protein
MTRLSGSRELQCQSAGANGVWTVMGAPPQELGGVAIAEIRKTDGRILRVNHGK